MNTFKLFITALILVSATTLSAANQDAIQNAQSPKQAYYQWKELYLICINEYHKYITDAIYENKLKKLKMSKEDFNSYTELCSKLKPSIDQMTSASDFSTPIVFDIDKWYELSCKFKDAIKNNIKDIEKNSDKKWEEYCNNLKEHYFALNKKYNDAMLNHAKGLISKNKEQENEIKALNDTITHLRGIEKEYKSIKKQKESTISNLDEVFRACVFFPLAVKYDETYTPLAYKAALGMYNNPHIPKNTQVKKEWKNYEPLLRDYNKYNQSVIRFIEDIQKKIFNNSDKPIDPSYYKQVFEQEGYAYSKYYNNKKVSIEYLDNVLNEFFTLLEIYVKNNGKPSEKFFRNFIINNLGSNYGQK